MNPISFVYTEILFRPLFNVLVGITSLLPTHSVGLATIAVTLLVRIILFPFAFHQARHTQQNQEKMATLQKEIKAIKKKHKNDRAKQAEAMSTLYREAGINPAAGCLPLLIQLPVLIALYRVFLSGVGPETYQYLYDFVTPPSQVELVFFGVDVSNPSVVMAVLAGVAQFVLMRFFTTPPATQPGVSDDNQEMMRALQRNMTYFFPVMTVFISIRLPAALALYWVASTIFAIGQQYIIKKRLHMTNAPATI